MITLCSANRKIQSHFLVMLQTQTFLSVQVSDRLKRNHFDSILLSKMFNVQFPQTIKFSIQTGAQWQIEGVNSAFPRPTETFYQVFLVLFYVSSFQAFIY